MSISVPLMTYASGIINMALRDIELKALMEHHRKGTEIEHR